MPRKPAWLAQIDDIRARIEATDPAEFFAFDRTTIASLFQITQRQAAKVLERSGGRKIGGAYIVQRSRLLGYLDGEAAAEESEEERERQLTLKETLTGILKKGPQLVAEEPLPPADSLLPANVQLTGPGRLEVSFESAGEVLGVALALAQLSDSNPAGFLSSLEYPSEEGDDE